MRSFAANDPMAVGALYAAQDAGLSVPKDLVLVGYDNRPVASYMRPVNTTIALPTYEMGFRAGHLMVELLKNEATNTEEIQIQGRRVIRGSCGSQPEDDSFYPTVIRRPGRLRLVEPDAL